MVGWGGKGRREERGTVVWPTWCAVMWYLGGEWPSDCVFTRSVELARMTSVGLGQGK